MIPSSRSEGKGVREGSENPLEVGYCACQNVELPDFSILDILVERLGYLT